MDAYAVCTKKNPTHVSAKKQPVQYGDKGGDEYDSLICTGYCVNSRPGPGFPYEMHYVWWHVSCAPLGWYMNNPTGPGIVPVPEDLNITPYFQSKESIEAQSEQISSYLSA
jgi:hypothetical protein